jgi:hypothetical protein
VTGFCQHGNEPSGSIKKAGCGMKMSAVVPLLQCFYETGTAYEILNKS